MCYIMVYIVHDDIYAIYEYMIYLLNNVFWDSDHLVPPALLHSEILILGMSFKLQFLYCGTNHFVVMWANNVNP